MVDLVYARTVPWNDGQALRSNLQKDSWYGLNFSYNFSYTSSQSLWQWNLTQSHRRLTFYYSQRKFCASLPHKGTEESTTSQWKRAIIANNMTSAESKATCYHDKYKLIVFAFFNNIRMYCEVSLSVMCNLHYT